MFGLGELGKIFSIILYVILSIPVFICLLNIIDRIKNKTSILKVSIITLISAIPLFLFGYYEYSKHKKESLYNVGVYILTNYPNCSDCKLELLEDNTYSVTSADRQLEKGQWNYESGSDYFIVSLSNGGQLGSGQYSYQKYNRKYKKE